MFATFMKKEKHRPLYGMHRCKKCSLDSFKMHSIHTCYHANEIFITIFLTKIQILLFWFAYLSFAIALHTSPLQKAFVIRMHGNSVYLAMSCYITSIIWCFAVAKQVACIIIHVCWQLPFSLVASLFLRLFSFHRSLSTSNWVFCTTSILI